MSRERNPGVAGVVGGVTAIVGLLSGLPTAHADE